MTTPPIEEAIIALEAILDDDDEPCPSPVGDEILDIIRTLQDAQEERDELVAALRGMVENACAAAELEGREHVIRCTKREWDHHVRATRIADELLIKCGGAK